jgi:hypothetical protein
MAELAIGLFAALGGGGAAATAAAGAGGGLFSGLLTAGSSALGILQGVATAASVVSTLVGGIGQADEAQQNARLVELQGNSEFLASQQKALDIKRDLAQKIGEARVAFAGSGLDISSASSVEGDLEDQADFQTSIEKLNGQQAKQMAAARAAQYRSSGTYDLVGASLKALGQVGGYGLDIAKRG